MSDLAPAFRFHAWATTRLIEFCATLSADVAEAGAPGTYGGIRATLGHTAPAPTCVAHSSIGSRIRRHWNGRGYVSRS